MMNNKFCKDCKHFKSWGILWYKDSFMSMCKLFPNKLDIVTGKIYKDSKYERCWSLRWPISGKCGLEGKYWESK